MGLNDRGDEFMNTSDTLPAQINLSLSVQRSSSLYVYVYVTTHW